MAPAKQMISNHSRDKESNPRVWNIIKSSQIMSCLDVSVWQEL